MDGNCSCGPSPVSARLLPGRVLPPALLHRLIVLAGARTRIGRLGIPIALEKETEAIVAPVVAARNGDIDRRPLISAQTSSALKGSASMTSGSNSHSENGTGKTVSDKCLETEADRPSPIYSM